MNILLVVDGSVYSDLASNLLKTIRFSSDTEVTILTVVPEPTFLGGITLDVIRGTSQARKKAHDLQQQKAEEIVQQFARTLSKDNFKVQTLIRWGNPVEHILAESEERNTSLIVMGAKGLTDTSDFRLGSVALKVMKYASCSVLLVRPQISRASQDIYNRSKKPALNRVLLATDGSRYAEAVIQFLLELPLISRQTEILLMTALQSHFEAWLKTPTLDFHTNQELLNSLHVNEEAEARKIIGEAEKQFQKKRYRTTSLVIRGDASESILATAREYKPDMIAVGSKGLTGIASFLMGSVAERVARYADCSVLIGRLSR